jgi:TonB-linked SusC/RagA family outer membrane protein
MKLLVHGKGRLITGWLPSKMLLVMKLTAVLLLVAALQVHARAVSQKVTLTVKEAPLEQVFARIKLQTGYSFVVSGNLLAGKKPVSLDVHDRPLEEVLTACLQNQSLRYTITDKIIVVSAASPVASLLPESSRYQLQVILTVTGKVSNEKNEPMEGVTVQLKGTDTKTSSDRNGVYTIKVPDGTGTLLFSFVGYAAQEVAVPALGTLDLILKEQKNDLNDVIIVGYGTQRKGDVTAAVSVVTSKMIENRPVTNGLAALQGTAPGLVITRTSGQPGKEYYSAQIRGTSSVSGSSVLILVDGVEQASIANINPNDIESVSVLKDAAAAAIYGSSAAGGVILVTTKKGKSGKMTLSYTGLYTTNKPYNMPKRLHSYEENRMLNEANVNAGQAASYTPQQLEWLKDPNVEYVVNATGQYNWYYDLNQIPILTRPTTVQQNHSISLTGGDEKTQYMFSGGWMSQNGLFRVGPDGFDRYNARLNMTTKLNNWLTFDAKIGYVKRKTLSPSMDVDGGSGILYNLYIIRSSYPIFFPGSNETKYADGGSLAYPNLKDGGQTTERSDAVNGVFTLQTNSLVKGLQLKAIYAPYVENYNYNRTLRSVPLWNVSGITTTLNPTNAYYVTKKNTYRSNAQFLADYNLDIAGDHHFHVMGGYQFESFRSEEANATAKNLSSNDLFALGLGTATQSEVDDDNITWATQSFFGRFNYNYREKYYAEATVRTDGSSRLAPGYRYKTFPSVSLGWRVSKESWFKAAIPFVNEMKLRGSMGILGNSVLSGAGFGYYDYIPQLSRTGSANSPLFNNVLNYGYFNDLLASHEKTWERINVKNIGLDLVFLKNRLSVTGDYYVKTNNNMLVSVKTTAMLGIGTSQYNYAALEAHGWELTLGWKDQIGKNFNYYVNANLSDTKNKVTSYLGKSTYVEGLNTIIEGEATNTIWGYQATGLYANADEVSKNAFVSNTTGPGDIRYADLNTDNKINVGKGTKADHGDLVNLGSTNPRYTYGFNFGFSVKGFDFSAFFQGVGQRSMLINSAFMLPFVSSWRQPNQEQTDYWTPTHMDARFPRLYLGGSSNTKTSSWWVQDAAYLRLKNLQVGYTLPAKWTSKAAISALRIYFSGQDMWESSKMWLKYYDPEEPNNSSTSYPFFRSYAVGLNITFK